MAFTSISKREPVPCMPTPWHYHCRGSQRWCVWDPDHFLSFFIHFSYCSFASWSLPHLSIGFCTRACFSIVEQTLGGFSMPRQEFFCHPPHLCLWSSTRSIDSNCKCHTWNQLYSFYLFKWWRNNLGHLEQTCPWHSFWGDWPLLHPLKWKAHVHTVPTR